VRPRFFCRRTTNRPLPMQQLNLFAFEDSPPRPRRPKRRSGPKEWKLVALRDCPLPSQMHLCDSPQRAADYWRTHIECESIYDPERECLVVLLLNTRRRIRGHHLVTIGTMDTLLVHPREVFRVAIMAAAAIVLMHNHPSGEPLPSDGDIKVTRELMRAGLLLKIEVLDHVIIGRPNHCSMKELGYMYGV
jgi:DNA repair protein RadC